MNSLLEMKRNICCIRSLIFSRRLAVVLLFIFIIGVLLIYDDIIRLKNRIVERDKSVFLLDGNLTWKSIWTSDFQEHARIADVHLQDAVLDQTLEVISHVLQADTDRSASLQPKQPITVVAIGLGITSTGIRRKYQYSESTLKKRNQFFHTFLPSFCRTASIGYRYDFYMAYDHTDRLFSKAFFLTAFQKAFHATVAINCGKTIKTSLHMVQCDHAKKPAWAQNDAMLEAYLDNAEYFFRVNDDTLIQTKNWTNIFVERLRQYNPPNVGVVGPMHTGGNTRVLSYDFVHRKHIDIFGYYYPRLFMDWWADTWMTHVYDSRRMTKFRNVHFVHTMRTSQRYSVNNYSVGGMVNDRLTMDRQILKRFLGSWKKMHDMKPPQQPDGTKIISMSLHGKDPVYTWGAIRNAQLTPVHFPGWRLRVYIWDDSFASNITHNCSANDSLAVPCRIISKLWQLGAEITTVQPLLENCTACMIQPKFWHYLVINDPMVEYFIIRDAASRLSERDAYAVCRWLEMTKTEGIVAPLHCIRDHPKHSDKAIVDGLWGGHALSIRLAIAAQNQSTMISMLDQFNTISHYFTVKNESNHIAVTLTSSNVNDSSYNLNTSHKAISFLEFFIWPVFKSRAMCHDSTSCEVVRWNSNNIHPVHRKRTPPSEYLGQKYDEHHELTSKDGELLDKFVGKECSNNTKSTIK